MAICLLATSDAKHIHFFTHSSWNIITNHASKISCAMAGSNLAYATHFI
jgi:hypothetical protein